MKQWIMLPTIVWFVLQVTAGASTLMLAIDERYCYPFTYMENSKAKGMHVDIVKDALKNLGYRVTITPYPRKRCILNSKKGKVDGMISIAYQADISGTLIFPPDAANDRESRWRIMQVDHMVITHTDDNYVFEGDIGSLPVPVRVPRGEGITMDLRKYGLKVEEVRTDKQNFIKLIRDKKGSVITTSVIAENMKQHPEFKGKFIIQATPIASQSYHLMFSQKSTLTAEERKKIWEEIARLRDDYVYMLQVFAQY